jgi:Predicted integral membrane protein (DUF2269)
MEAQSIRMLRPATRRALLTTHIVASVGLLGDVSAFLVVAIQAASTGDPAFAATSYDLLATFSAVFGIPLSIVALATGVTLGRGTKWGVFKTPWVAIKLGLLASVILMGALVLGPSVEQMRTGAGGTETRIVLGAAWDVLALTLATVLSVYKPGRTRSRRR